ncbi:MAG: glycosyltransferase family 4 protein [Leptolyngbyaceae bacterium]|nr:glycosyltransferase family 4 protein [Leptolyngbyaceae bacterium]
MNNPTPRTIALFPWGDWIEDFLDSIQLSLQEFCDEMSGGWLFGYIEALKLEGIQTVIVCVSAQVDVVTYQIHKPTGAKIYVFPAPRLHRWVRQKMVNPYGWNVQETFGPHSVFQRPLLSILRDMAAYLATPMGAIAQILRQENCTAILCQEYEYARFDICILLGKRLGLPVFATFQGGNFQLSRIEGLLRPHTLRASAGLIVPSQVEIERLQQTYGLPSSAIAQIFNPLDQKLWQGDRAENPATIRHQTRTALQLPQDAKVVVYHGRMELYRKGLDVLLDAWAQLCHTYAEENWWLLLVGTGSDAKVIGDRIAQLPKPTVRWINEYVLDRDLMRRYLMAADLYTLPSRHEGFPVAPLEAMACGLPVVATDAPGVADILLENGASMGGIVVPREQPEALGEAIAHLLRNEETRLELKQKALHRIETHFSLKTVGKRLGELILSQEQ